MLNKCEFIGNLGADPEFFPHGSNRGSDRATFSIACNEKWTDKNTGEKKEKTEWVRCVAWGRTAEIVSEYLSKGSQVYIEGKMTTSKYIDKEGIEKYSTSIQVNRMLMLGSKKDSRPKSQAIKDDPHWGDESDDEIPF